VVELRGSEPPFHGAEIGELADVGLEDEAEVGGREITKRDRGAYRDLPNPGQGF
jgi:hypothetical protein